jgi:hypothetical protein
LRLAGPTIVVGELKAGVWNAIPFCAGTTVQSYGGFAAHAFAEAARSAAGRTAGFGWNSTDCDEPPALADREPSGPKK